MTTPGVSERFWSKVDIRGDDECWPWKAGVDRKGYGRFYFSGGREHRKHYTAHRAAYILSLDIEHTDLNPEIATCHICDNPPCCNPRHLFLGSWADNLADMTRKGRRRNGISVGEKNGCAKLTESQVRDIRGRFKEGESKSTLGKRFRVYPSTIDAIVRGIKWAHLDDAKYCENPPRGSSNKEKTHCPQGHPYDGNNTQIHSTTGARRCRACRQQQERKYYQEKKNRQKLGTQYPDLVRLERSGA